jgi:2-amino-4-hydroxy-6-hydroxymethyldihydropteridine diphosphokinase
VGEIVHIGLGSNQGDREGNLLAAVDGLRRIDAVSVVAVSSLYDSAPVGPPQPRYLNAVAQIDCELAPLRLLGILHRIEQDLGRNRAQEQRWGPRTIDLDLLLWDREIVAEPQLQVPHLFLHQRRFALEPLLELAPDAFHPVLNVPLSELLSRLPAQDVARHASAAWPRDFAEPSSR